MRFRFGADAERSLLNADRKSRRVARTTQPFRRGAGNDDIGRQADGEHAVRPLTGAIPNDERAQYDALFDPDTGLPRWAILLDRTDVAIASARRINRRFATFVLADVVTLDGASPNVEQFVESLRGKIRSDDTIARIAEHSFILLCGNLRSDADAESVARRLGHDDNFGFRMGFALSGGDADAETLLSAAIRAADFPLPAIG